MADGQRSMLAFWMGGAGSSAADAGTRSMLVPWMGGAGSATGTSGGARGMLAPWMGGAGSAPTASAAGVQSLLAFWMGGAGSLAAAAQDQTFSPGVRPYRIHLPPHLMQAQVDGLMTGDELLLIMAGQIAAGLIH